MEKIGALEEAIQQKSLSGIYSVFYTIAHGDPNFSTGKFQETLNYIKSKNIEGFMQEFDGEELKGEECWDKNYWAYIASSLMDNFCEVRIEHLNQVGKKVYPVIPKAPRPTEEVRKPKSGNNAGKTYPNPSIGDKVKIGAKKFANATGSLLRGKRK